MLRGSRSQRKLGRKAARRPRCEVPIEELGTKAVKRPRDEETSEEFEKQPAKRPRDAESAEEFQKLLKDWFDEFMKTEAKRRKTVDNLTDVLERQSISFDDIAE